MGMTKYVIQRILLIFLTLFIVLSLTYILTKLMPIEMGTPMFQDQYRFYNEQLKLGSVDLITDKYQPWMDNDPSYIVLRDKSQAGNVTYYIFRWKPILEQYWNFLVNVFTRWDWGVSSKISPSNSTIDIIASRLPTSLRLNIISTLIAVPIGFSLGIWAALKKNKPTDHIISTLVMIFISIPSFVLIVLILKWFGYDLGWLPTKWPATSDTDLNRFKGYIIPVSCLCFGTIAAYARYTRAELTEVMSSEFLLLARTKGLTKRQTIIRHALRNSLVPLVPMVIGEFIGILSGSMILERIYNIPGIGDLFYNAIMQRDYPVIMTDMAIVSLIGLVAVLIVDLSYGIVDPRIRMGARK